MADEQDSTCPVCFEPKAIVDGMVRPGCGHEICLPCYSIMRDRNTDPTCVLCRRPYYNRPVANDIIWDAVSADETHGWIENYIQTTGQRLRYERGPLAYLGVSGVRPIVAAADDPVRRVMRSAARGNGRPALSSLRYRLIIKLLRGPAVYLGTNDPVPPAAISNNCSLREMQARILGLKAASEAQRSASVALKEKRAATKGLTGSSDRVTATKTFNGAVAPVRGFRFGDIHIRSGDGVVGKCIGHHLWSYEDGSRWRKGRLLPIRHAVLEAQILAQ